MEDAGRIVACLVRFESNSRNVVAVSDIISGTIIYLTEHPVDSFAMSRKGGLITLFANVISFRDLGIEISSDACQSKLLSPPVLWTVVIDFGANELDHGWVPTELRFSNAGDRFFAQTWTNIRIFEAATGLMTTIIDAFDVDVAFSPSSSDVLISCRQGRRDGLRYWNAQTGEELPSLCPTGLKPLPPLQYHSYSVELCQKLVFSPSAKFLASTFTLMQPDAQIPVYRVVVHDTHTGMIVAEARVPYQFDLQILGFVGEEELVLKDEHRITRHNIFTDQVVSVHALRQTHPVGGDNKRFLSTFDAHSQTVLVVDAETHPVKITGISTESSSPVFEISGPSMKCVPLKIVGHMQPATVLL